jgi:hypothetical protein
MLTFVVNKRSIHLQTPGPEYKQLCGAWRYAGRAMPKATDEQLTKLKLCSKCEKIARGRDDAPPLPFRPHLTDEDRRVILAALEIFDDYDHRAKPLSEKFKLE